LLKKILLANLLIIISAVALINKIKKKSLYFKNLLFFEININVIAIKKAKLVCLEIKPIKINK
jgi:hypothetical protein